MLLQRGACTEVSNISGETAVVIAAQSRHWMIARRLADAKANLEVHPDNDEGLRKTILVLAVEACQWDTVMHLVRRGADLRVRSEGGITMLMWASDRGQDDVVYSMLSARACVNAIDDIGDTALLRACNRNLETTARILWESGAEIDDALNRTRCFPMQQLLSTWSLSGDG